MPVGVKDAVVVREEDLGVPGVKGAGHRHVSCTGWAAILWQHHMLQVMACKRVGKRACVIDHVHLVESD
jgi:hypothetical protein